MSMSLAQPHFETHTRLDPRWYLQLQYVSVNVVLEGLPRLDLLRVLHLKSLTNLESHGVESQVPEPRQWLAAVPERRLDTRKHRKILQQRSADPHVLRPASSRRPLRHRPAAAARLP